MLTAPANKAAAARFNANNSPAALADRRQNSGLRAQIQELLIRRKVATGPKGSMGIPHKCFTSEERQKFEKVAFNNRADVNKLQDFIFRVGAEVERRMTKDTRAYMWGSLVNRAVEQERTKMGCRAMVALKEQAEKDAAALLASLPEEQLEGYSKDALFHVLKAVLNKGFLYSKQRQDGGVTIYGKDPLSPSAVSKIGAAETPQIVALAGRLAKKNAYVGQQWEKLNSSAGY